MKLTSYLSDDNLLVALSVNPLTDDIWRLFRCDVRHGRRVSNSEMDAAV